MTKELKYHLRYAKLAHFKILKIEKTFWQIQAFQRNYIWCQNLGFLCRFTSLKIKRSATRKSNFDDLKPAGFQHTLFGIQKQGHGFLPTFGFGYFVQQTNLNHYHNSSICLTLFRKYS